MKLLKKDNGVTLTVLIITIIVLLILASTATYTGVSTIQNSKLTAFTTEMKIIQSEVKYLQSKIEIDKEGNKTINGRLISDIGEEVPTSSSEIIEMQNNMSTVWRETVDLNAYRYYNTEKLKNDLNISEIKQVVPVLIDLETASVISVNGIKYEGKIYYKLEQLPDNIYKVESTETSTSIPTFDVTSETTKDEMKIILSNIQINSEYVAKYKIQYRAIENTDWTTVAENLTIDNYSFNVQAPGTYLVKIIDAKDIDSGFSEVRVTKYQQLKADGSWSETKGVNTPKLEGTGLIPIYWDNDGNEIEVTAENQDNWYDYSNQKWANAVTKDTSGNITGYWVWIPRYAYKITSNLGTSTAGEIQVTFVDEYNKNGDVIYKETYPEVVDNAMQDYVVHPAFTTNINNGGWSNDIPGFWVAKYAAGFQQCTQTVNEDGTVTEPTTDTSKVIYSSKKYTSYSSYTTNALSQDLSESNYLDQQISYPVFKPLTYAYNVISIGDSFTISREIQNATSFYGLNNNIDSHMQKNSEWGAVSYLTQSSYGRNGTEVTINSKNLNNLNSKIIYAVTGYAESTAKGVNASSTGNISGVFDLNGCVWERKAGFISNGNINLLTYGKSILTETNVTYDETENTVTNSTGSSTKYATIYLYDSSNDSNTNNYAAYKNAQTNSYGFGDNILETSSSGSGSNSWNGDYSNFPATSGPVFVRGGGCSYGSISDVFAFSNTSGRPNGDDGFRAVLVAQ